MSPAGARRAILALGFLHLGLATVEIGLELAAGNTIFDAVSVLLIVGVPGVILLVGGRWLEHADVAPEIYPRVLVWTLGGMAALLTVVGLRVASPGGSVDDPIRASAFATALGSAAGMGLGIYEGQAISRARVAERRSEELEETKDELEEKVQRLRELNNRLEQFAFAASHDLKEPMRMVSTYLQLLEQRYADELDEEAEEYIGYAVDGAQRMTNMIESLLAYSRVTTAGEPLAPTDTEAVAQEAREDLEPRIEETDAEIEIGKLPTVMADPSQLRAVFRNLLANALAYSGERFPRVRVQARREDANWVFAVRDEGIGIDPAYHEKVFEAFERLSADTESTEPGAGGVGLALCRRIVERHGGEIWVESDPGEGSTFYFTIPVRERGSQGLDDVDRSGTAVRA